MLDVSSVPAPPVRCIGPPTLGLRLTIDLGVGRTPCQGSGCARGTPFVGTQLANQGLKASSFEEGLEGLRMLRQESFRCVIVTLAENRSSPRSKVRNVPRFHCPIPCVRTTARRRCSDARPLAACRPSPLSDTAAAASRIVNRMSTRRALDPGQSRAGARLAVLGFRGSASRS